MPSSRSVLATLLVASWLAAAAVAQQVAAPVYPRSIGLTVTDSRDVPVSGALVEVWDDERAAGVRHESPVRPSTSKGSVSDAEISEVEPPRLTLHTDASGMVRVPLGSATSVFAASAPGVGTSQLRYAEDIEAAAFAVKLRPGSLLSGTVQFADGQPVPSAGVHFDGVDTGKSPARREFGIARTPPDVVTDAEGRFQVNIEWAWNGRGWAQVGDSVTEKVFLPVAGSSGTPAVLRLPGQFHVRGTCLLPGGGPAAGLRVQTGRRLTDSCEAMTGQDGFFDIPVVHAGRYALDVRLWSSNEHLVLPEMVAAEVREGAPVADVVIQLREGATLGGVVHGDFPGEAEVRVLLSDSREWRSRPMRMRSHVARVEAGGTFEIVGLVPGESYDVLATLDSEASTPGQARKAGVKLHDVQAGTRDLQITLDPPVLAGGEIDVRCVDAVSGAPLASAKVQDAWWNQSWTAGPSSAPPRKDVAPCIAEGDGAVRFSALSFAEQRAFIISAEGYESLSLGPFDPGPVRLTVHAELAPLVPRTVHVQDADGSPVCDAVVEFFDLPAAASDGFPFRALKTDGHGDVVLTLAQGKPHWLQANLADRGSALLQVSFLPGDAALVLKLQPPGAEGPRGALDVSVVDGDGKPMPGITVDLTPMTAPGDLSASLKQSCVTDAAGRVHVSELWPAAWTVGCTDRDRGFGFGYVAVPAGTTTSFVVIAP